MGFNRPNQTATSSAIFSNASDRPVRARWTATGPLGYTSFSGQKVANNDTSREAGRPLSGGFVGGGGVGGQSVGASSPEGTRTGAPVSGDCGTPDFCGTNCPSRRGKEVHKYSYRGEPSQYRGPRPSVFLGGGPSENGEGDSVTDPV